MFGESNELFSFLENLNSDTEVVLSNELSKLIYVGKVCDIPEHIKNRRVIKGSVKNNGSYISITVIKEKPVLSSFMEQLESE